MKTIKSISTAANQLRERFQILIVNEYIKLNGSLVGYRGQIYIMLPRYDKKTALYKGFSKETYEELRSYLFRNQSQRRFNHPEFENCLTNIRAFENKDFSICFNRVWHNGTSCYSGKHWAAQAAALFAGVKKFGFSFYRNDYNFSSRLFEDLEKADRLLKSIYSKILDRKMAELNIVSHE